MSCDAVKTLAWEQFCAFLRGTDSSCTIKSGNKTLFVSRAKANVFDASLTEQFDMLYAGIIECGEYVGALEYSGVYDVACDTIVDMRYEVARFLGVSDECFRDMLKLGRAREDFCAAANKKAADIACMQIQGDMVSPEEATRRCTNKDLIRMFVCNEDADFFECGISSQSCTFFDILHYLENAAYADEVADKMIRENAVAWQNEARRKQAFEARAKAAELDKTGWAYRAREFFKVIRGLDDKVVNITLYVQLPDRVAMVKYPVSCIGPSVFAYDFSEYRCAAGGEKMSFRFDDILSATYGKREIWKRSV